MADKCFQYVKHKVYFRGVEYDEKDGIIIDQNEDSQITIMEELNVCFLDENHQNMVFYGKTRKIWYFFKTALYAKLRIKSI